MKRALLGLLLLWAACPEPVEGAKTLSVICYHRFGAETAKDPYKISIERLNAQLDWLKAQGYESVSLAQVDDAAAHGPARLPEKALILSVDDGYKAGALGAAAFEAHGFKGVYFVNPGALGRGAFMSWDDCRSLERRGHEVASHTLTHGKLPKPLPGQDPAGYKAWVFKELVEAKRLLEKELKHPVTALAYPYGAYNPAVSRAALAAGYATHYTVSDGVNESASLDPLRLRRILLMGHPSQAAFEKRLRLEPVTLPFKAMQEGALFYEHAAAAALSPVPEGLKLSVDGKAVQSLPGGLGRGFHFLTLDQGPRQTKLLFQVADPAWEPYFKALTEN